MKYHFLPFLLTAFTVGCVGLPVPSAESSAVPESVTSEIAATDNALKITELIQIDPIQVEADLRYENGSGAYIKLDNPDEIQALMNELTAVSVRETENSVGHSFFSVYCRFTDSQGNERLISDADTLVISDVVNPARYYHYAGSLRMLDILDRHVPDEVISKGDESLPTQIEMISYHDLADSLQKKADILLPDQSAGAVFTYYRLHLSHADEDASYSILRQYYHDGQWVTSPNRADGFMLDNNAEYYFQTEINEGLLRFVQLRASRCPVSLLTAENSVFRIYSEEHPEFHAARFSQPIIFTKGEGVILASSQEEDLGKVLHMDDFITEDYIEMIECGQRLVLMIE